MQSLGDRLEIVKIDCSRMKTNKTNCTNVRSSKDSWLDKTTQMYDYHELAEKVNPTSTTVIVCGKYSKTPRR